MELDRSARRDAYLGKARADLAHLAKRGVIISGNAFSSVLFVKGATNEQERGGAAPLSGADGTALRAALSALGYAPEDWCAVLSTYTDGSAIDPDLLRETVCTLDPATLIACDEPAAQALREAYATELSRLDDFDEAMLVPGRVARILGIRMMNLGGFETALASPRDKQIMWRRLKDLPPLGAPY